MNKISCFTILIITLTAVLLSAASCDRQTGDEATNVIINPNWPNRYDDLKELAADADLIIAGTVISAESVPASEDWYVSPEVTISNTHALLHIDRTVKGYSEYEAEVVVFQLGAPGFGAEPGNPIFEAGEQCFLFLRKEGNGLFGLLHPNARFRIEDGKVSSMDQVLPDEARVAENLSVNKVELDAFIIDVIDAIREDFFVPEETPAVSMNLWKVMNGTNDELSIYEDGTVIYTKEWGLRMAGIVHPAMRSWRTGTLSEEEMNELAELIQNEEFTAMERTLSVSKPLSGVMGDMHLKLNIDLAGIQKSINADGYISPDKGMTYPSMPYPADEIYKTLKDIAENKTEELYREEI